MDGQAAQSKHGHLVTAQFPGEARGYAGELDRAGADRGKAEHVHGSRGSDRDKGLGATRLVILSRITGEVLVELLRAAVEARAVVSPVDRLLQPIQQAALLPVGPAPRGSHQGSRRLGRTLQQPQYARGVAGAQHDALGAVHDLASRRQRAPHDEAGQVQPFMGRCRGQEPLFLFGRPELDPVLSSGAGPRHDDHLQLYGSYPYDEPAVNESRSQRSSRASARISWSAPTTPCTKPPVIDRRSPRPPGLL